MERRQPRVLVVDDDQRITTLLSEILQEEGYKVEVFNSSKDVLYLARQFQPDLLLLDVMMPEIDGCHVCDYFRSDPELKFARIIVVTGRDDRETRVQCFAAGADLVLIKPFDADELRMAVRSNINARMAQRELVDRLQEQANTDAAVNCYTRKHMERRISEELNRAARHDHPVSLLLFDIDHFRTVNQRFGYEFGNNVLKIVAEAARAQVRESDVLGRFSEDTFVVLLPETDGKGAKKTASRICQTIASLVLPRKKLSIRCTTGILTVETKMKLDEVLPALEEQLKKAQALKIGKR